MTLTTIREVKLGDYVRLACSETAPVWVRGEYDRSTKTYEMHRADDINDSKQFNPRRNCYVGFTY